MPAPIQPPNAPTAAPPAAPAPNAAQPSVTSSHSSFCASTLVRYAFWLSQASTLFVVSAAFFSTARCTARGSFGSCAYAACFSSALRLSWASTSHASCGV